MRTSLFIIVFLVFHLFAKAQDGIVTVEQDPKITKLMNIYKKMNSETGFFTIQIGFGSYAAASKLKSEASIDFPQYNSNIIFDSPTYRVHLGRFKDKLDVERIFTEVRKKYPESIILKPVTSTN
ncbi:SPOR domain-containing protein [Muriicola sp.]|uniref:SPOR domain-containing protein n=1 Tax=Muriicola sp. TaxID=2020856 RepID=UPI003C76DDC5